MSCPKNLAWIKAEAPKPFTLSKGIEAGNSENAKKSRVQNGDANGMSNVEARRMNENERWIDESWDFELVFHIRNTKASHV